MYTPNKNYNYVSILIPIYNADKYLSSCIYSILNQSHRNFELILLDDGSTDKSSEICKSFLNRDPRVLYVYHENSGMAFSLNKGMDLAKHDLVARFDADDIMYPNRLEVQISYLNNNPDIDILGSLGHYINSNDKIIGKTYSDVNMHRIKDWYIPNNEPIGLLHPSVIFKKSIIQSIGGYRGQFWPCEDIDLWNRAIENGANIHVIQKYLIKYRLHSSSAIAKSHLHNRKLYRWVRECMRLRRSGLSEISLSEFSSSYNFSFNRMRKDYCKLFYRNSGLNFFKGSIFSKINGIFKIIIALILDPKYVIPKIIKQIY